MILVFICCVFIAIDYLVFDKKLRELELLLLKLDKRITFLDEVNKNEIGVD